MEKTVIIIEGTHCNACKLVIEDTCKEMIGVKSCIVNFQTGQTVIEHDKSFDLNSLKKEVENLGLYKIKFN